MNADRAAESSVNTGSPRKRSRGIGLALMAVAVASGCEEPVEPPPGESLAREVLTLLYGELDGPDWNRSDNWVTDQPPGSWYGVTTDSEGNVTGLHLPNNELAGSIPRELGKLRHLEILNLAGNSLWGPIPPEFGNLESLTELRLGAARLRGPIPPELGNLRHLETLNLALNSLTGPIPPEFGNLQNLERLSFWQNQRLNGSVPPELGKLDNLEELHLASTALSGRLPAELVGVPLADFAWNGTELCAPADDAFQEWLASIDRHAPGPNCPPE